VKGTDVRHFDVVLDRVTEAIHHSGDDRSAMEAAVRTLEREVPHYTWVGIYLLDGNELVLGPFVGKPSPHTRIPLGRGICGAAAAEKATIIVDDVNADPRYLACSLETRSEIVCRSSTTATCWARSTSTAITWLPSARRTRRCSKPSPTCSPSGSTRSDRTL